MHFLPALLVRTTGPTLLYQCCPGPARCGARNGNVDNDDSGFAGIGLAQRKGFLKGTPRVPFVSNRAFRWFGPTHA
jgi:hypothetical protein